MSNREKAIWVTVIGVHLVIASLTMICFIINEWFGAVCLLAAMWPYAKRDAISIIKKAREGDK